MTSATFTFNGCSLAIAAPPPPAPKGAALVTINGWTFGLSPRSAQKLADVMQRQQEEPTNHEVAARFGLDPDCNLVLDVGCSNSLAGVTLTVVEHGAPTDVQITVPYAETSAVADALAHH